MAPKWEERFPPVEERQAHHLPFPVLAPTPSPNKLVRCFFVKQVIHAKRNNKGDLRVRTVHMRTHTHTHPPHTHACTHTHTPQSAPAFLLYLEENVIRLVPSDEPGRQIPQMWFVRGLGSWEWVSEPIRCYLALKFTLIFPYWTRIPFLNVRSLALSW